MGEPTIAVAPALARVASLGVVLAGCPACHRVIGLAGALGLVAHRRTCPKRRRPLGVIPPAATVDPCESRLLHDLTLWKEPTP